MITAVTARRARPGVVHKVSASTYLLAALRRRTPRARCGGTLLPADLRREHTGPETWCTACWPGKAEDQDVLRGGRQPLIYRQADKAELLAHEPERYFRIVKAQRRAERAGLPIPSDDEADRSELAREQGRTS